MAVLITPGSEEERIAIAVVRWIDLVRRSGNPRYRETWLPTNADLCKSALLARLLEGREPLVLPPPRCFSYPWHSLVDEGRATLKPGSVEGPFRGEAEQGLDPNQRYLSVCEDLWELVEESEDSRYTLSYYGEDRWLLAPLEEDGESLWELRRLSAR